MNCWELLSGRPLVAVLSPAKRMAPASLPGREPSRPLFEAEAVRLAEVLRACPAWQLESLLGINPELALRAFLDYQGFGRAEASPALLSYRGLAYQYLEAETFTAEDWDYAADHLRLLSALYGVLRPEDGMRPLPAGAAVPLPARRKNAVRLLGRQGVAGGVPGAAGGDQPGFRGIFRLISRYLRPIRRGLPASSAPSGVGS